MRPLKDPIKEAERVERATAMTKVLLNQALADRKAAEQAKEDIKGVDGIVSA
jgi:hypothetical protein